MHRSFFWIVAWFSSLVTWTKANSLTPHQLERMSPQECGIPRGVPALGESDPCGVPAMVELPTGRLGDLSQLLGVSRCFALLYYRCIVFWQTLRHRLSNLRGVFPDGPGAWLVKSLSCYHHVRLSVHLQVLGPRGVQATPALHLFISLLVCILIGGHPTNGFLTFAVSVDGLQ